MPNRMLLGALLAGASCGGKVVVDRDEGAGSGGGTTASTSTSNATNGSGAASGHVSFSIADVQVRADCMPEVGPDPLHVSFVMTYDNTDGANTLEVAISAARVKLGDVIPFAFTVEPSATGPIKQGTSLTLTHTKVPGSGSGDAAPCDYCATFTTLEFDMVATGTDQGGFAQSNPLACVY